jgi:hypothetical protein
MSQPAQASARGAIRAGDTMKTTSLHHLIARWLCAIVLLAASGWAAADPPSRVARLAYVSGESSFSPAGEREWVRPVVNRPLITGDRLWVDRGGRAELQLGVAAVRLGSETSMRLLNLDDRVAQVELTQGTLNLRVRRLDRGQIFEVDTPNVAFSIRRPGLYRIDVDPDDQITTVTVRAGLGAVYGEGRAFVVGERRSYRFYDTGLRDYEFLSLPAFDELDRWAAERERRWENSASRRHVSAEMIGSEDLDQYGTWRQVPDYGFVWVPRRLPANWAPYREGHWAWVEPWGWTWVDDAPWGFAPSHYGRWARVDDSWAWVPGPAKTRPVYAPALVAFVGGGSLQAGGGNGTVAWFPLGPREVYRPAYPVSREYFVNVNTSNTVVNNTVVTTIYNNRDNREQANVSYSNRQVPGAVVAVLAAVFAQSRPVARETVQMNRDAIARAQITAVAPVAPVHASIAGPAVASARPPAKVETRAVVAQTPPPPAPVPFAARQSALAAQPGKPLAPAAVAALKPAPSASAPAPAPAVKVVKPSEPVAAPPPPPPPANRAAAAAAVGASAAQAAAAQPGAPASRPAAMPRPVPPAASVPRGPAPAGSASPAPERAAAPAMPAAPVASAPSPKPAPGLPAPAATSRPAPERAAAPPAPPRPAPEAAKPAPRASAEVPVPPVPVPPRAPAAVAPPSAPPAAAARPAAPEPSAAQRPDLRQRAREERETRPQRGEGATPAAPPAAAPAEERKPPVPPAARAATEERKPPAAPAAAAPARPAPAPPPPPPSAAAPAKPVTPPAAAPDAAPKKEAPAAAPPPAPAARAEHAAPPGPPAAAASRAGPRPATAEGRARGPREAASEPGEAGPRERKP